MLKSGLEFDDEEYLSDSRSLQVKQDFRFNILYTDPSPLNYITEAKDAAGNPVPFPSTPTANNRVAETPLLKVFNLDKLNYNNDPQTGGDGFFDFVQGID
jgi:cell surface protein SprA